MKSYIAFFAVVLLFTQTTHAQIIDRTEDRAKQKANNRIDRKIDEGLDKSFDAIEGLFSKKKKKADQADSKEKSTENTENEGVSQSEAEANMLSAMMGGSDVNIQDSYTFDHNVLLNIQTFDKNGKPSEVNHMTMYFADESPNFGMSVDMEGSNNFMIYDMTTYEMVSLIDNNGQKIGMAMKLNPEKFIDEEADEQESNENISFEKTGRTKVISGYSCEEYKLIDPEDDSDMETTFWITDDTDANWMKMMSKIAMSNEKMEEQYGIPENYPKGSMIQIINTSTKNEEKSVITVEKINKNQKKVVDTSGYQMMALPSSKK